MAQTVKCLPAMQETQLWSLGWEDLLEKEMETHSSTFAWKIPGMEEPGRLQSMESQRVGHDWTTSLLSIISCMPLGEWLNLFMPQFPHLYNGDNSSTYLIELWVNTDKVPDTGLPRWRSGKESVCQSKRCRRLGFNQSIGHDWAAEHARTQACRKKMSAIIMRKIRIPGESWPMNVSLCCHGNHCISTALCLWLGDLNT